MGLFNRQSSPLQHLSLLFFICNFGLLGCGGSSDSSSSNPQTATRLSYTYTAPTVRADDWQVASATDLGLSVSTLEQLIDSIEADTFGFRNMDGVLIVKQNQLLFEEQLRTELDVSDGWAENRNLDVHAVHSVTKSVTSAAIGIALERGEIGSIDDAAVSYFDDLLPLANDSSEKQTMTIENWLTMQHGLQWNEWDVNYLSDSNQNKQMIDSVTPMRFLLDLPSTTPPGSIYAYSTGISYALGRIISRASGERFYDYIQRYLFQPMNINDHDAWMIQNDLHGGSGLYLSMRSMAKFGQMYLDDGQWLGQQIVPSSWVEVSTQEHVSQENIRYGYQWWINTFTVNGQSYESFYANGWGGQYIMIFPELESVVILTGRRYQDGQAQQTDIRAILEQYILPFLLQ